MKDKISLSLLGLVFAGLLASGCASSQEQGPAGAATPGIPATAPTSAPGAIAAPTTAPAAPGATVAPGATAAATSQVQGARATPEGTVTSTDGQGLLQEMEQFQGKLRQLAGDNPQQAGLTQMTEQATQLMQRLNQGFLQMSLQQREEALSGMVDITGLMIQVVQAEGGGAAPGSPTISATPLPMQGLPGALTPAPSPQATAQNPLLGQPEMLDEINRLRQDIQQEASNQPTQQDVVQLLGRMRQILALMQAQVNSILAADTTRTLDGMVGAMHDMQELMQSYIQQANRASPGQSGTPSRLP